MSVSPRRDDRRMTSTECPTCGSERRESIRIRRCIYFVDLVCDECGVTEVDEKGGM